MKRVVIIANRMAGRGGMIHSLIQQAKRTLWGWPVEVFLPQDAHEAQRFCQSLDPQTTESVLVLGGDGTLNQVLPGLVHREIPVCPVPVGTANDLSKKLGICLDWELIQLLLDRRSIDPIDIVEVNGRPFATIGGMGVGAILTKEFNERRRESSIFRATTQKLKTQVYTFMSVKTILLRQDYIHDLRITAPHFHERLESGAIFVCNQTALGGNMTVAARAFNNDEKFDVFVLPKLNKKRMLRALMSLKEGRPPQEAIQFSSTEMIIEDMDNRDICAFGDGEHLVNSPRLEFKVMPRSLWVYHQDLLHPRVKLKTQERMS